MSEYPKINSLFQRNVSGRFTAEYSCPEFEYLADKPWIWTEKVDGTNIRLYYPAAHERDRYQGNEHMYVKGRTDNAQLPPKLLNACVELVRSLDLGSWAEKHIIGSEVVFFGEGYGAGIQKGGQYRPDPSFVLFDVKIDQWWLQRSSVEEVAAELGFDIVPVVCEKTLLAMDWDMRNGIVFPSAWSEASPEGVVGRPKVDLWNRKGERIITKLKFKDYR